MGVLFVDVNLLVMAQAAMHHIIETWLPDPFLQPIKFFCDRALNVLGNSQGQNTTANSTSDVKHLMLYTQTIRLCLASSLRIIWLKKKNELVLLK